MAQSLRHLQQSDLAFFRPEEAKEEVLKGEAIIDYCKKTKNWEDLSKAVEIMIGLQTKIVAWWQKEVAKPRDFGRGKLSADRGEVYSLADAERLIKFSHQTIAKWNQRLADTEEYARLLRGPSYHTAMAQPLGTIRGTEGTGEFERYTPGKYIDLVREVLGEIDLDPATSEIAQQTVRATQFFTQKDDGLSQEWNGRVFLNPPYHRQLAPLFITKLIAEFDTGRTTAAIMLTNNSTDTEWFIEAAKTASAICFTKGRIGFLTARGEGLFPTQGQAFFYFGTQPQRFFEVFREIGLVMSVWL